VVAVAAIIISCQSDDHVRPQVGSPVDQYDSDSSIISRSTYKDTPCKHEAVQVGYLHQHSIRRCSGWERLQVEGSSYLLGDGFLVCPYTGHLATDAPNSAR
jgi:hypothetical protein